MINNTVLLLQAAQKMAAENYDLRMTHYRSDGNGCYVEQTSLSRPCGSFGCALGNLPFLNIKGLDIKPEHHNELRNGMDWDEYSTDVFGIIFYDNLWRFLFSDNWGDLPKSYIQTKEFLERAEHVHTHKKAPEGWIYSSYKNNWGIK